MSMNFIDKWHYKSISYEKGVLGLTVENHQLRQYSYHFHLLLLFIQQRGPDKILTNKRNYGVSTIKCQSKWFRLGL